MPDRRRRGGDRARRSLRAAPRRLDGAAPLTQLLLFDIDGTLLLRASAAHRDALHAALVEVYGIDEPARHPVEAAGRTDLEIVRAILVAAGYPLDRVEPRFADLRAVATAAYARLVPDTLAAHVAPGVVELLEWCAACDELTPALVTGNLEPIARIKLARAGLGRFFATGQGGFGSDAEDRSELPAIARARAGVRGAPHPRERTWVIGDTPRDILCARADGVRCLAVTTGPYAAEELTGADAVCAGAAAVGEHLATFLRISR